jgi:Z1 domain
MTIELLHDDLELGPGSLWQPVVGDEALRLIESLDISEESARRLLGEAIRVLAKCAPPHCTTPPRTGLAVGYVQSGKTMSFTTLAALARDNGYQAVVLIAGTSVPLFQQSLNRLKSDLGLERRRDRSWLVMANPGVVDQSVMAAMDVLAEHADGEEDARTLLFVVMKHHQHLANLAGLFGRFGAGGRPVLIIDDEADQASLNAAVRTGEETTTYLRIMELRAALGCHSFVQYTATPQAPLLINIIDSLSPEFAEVLTPGEDYTGGATFFEVNSKLAEAIPPNDELAHDDSEPPASLLKAMRIFYIGVACGLIEDGGSGNRSMMVHPSQRVARHDSYFRWVREARGLWLQLLQLAPGEADRQAIIEEFREAWVDLRGTAPNCPEWEAIEPVLVRAIRRTLVHLVNAARGQTPQIDWTAAYPHILVGGQAMDRGFTVEGLTVTYMPRAVGVGNADTIQQRARFFGYKKAYIGLCRVYLNAEAANAYKRYVSHEEDVRARLEKHADMGLPLADWKRAFFLHRTLKPTRDSVLNLDYMRIPMVEKWLDVKAPHRGAAAIEVNRTLTDEFVATLRLTEMAGHADRTDMMRHLVSEPVLLSSVMDEYLTRFRVASAADSHLLTGVLIQLQNIVDANADARARIYVMSGGRERERRTNQKDDVENIYQGAHPDKEGAIYPGDQKIFDEEFVTIQLHYLRVTAGRGSAKVTLGERIPTIAVRIPVAFADDLYIQH